MGPNEFVEALVANKQYVAAIDFIAHALPAREAIWWGCLCLQHATRRGSFASRQGGLQSGGAMGHATNRRESRGCPSPGPRGWAGYSGGSVGRWPPIRQVETLLQPNAPPMPPAPFAPAKAVARAVKMATAKADPVKIIDTQRLLVELGIGVAEGRFR